MEDGRRRKKDVEGWIGGWFGGGEGGDEDESCWRWWGCDGGAVGSGEAWGGVDGNARAAAAAATNVRSAQSCRGVAGN